MTIDTVVFFFLAFGSVVTALLMATHRNPVMSLLYLIANFFFLAILYLTLQAQFIAIIQILVYAGAIMVLFLFVIMLLKLGDDQRLQEKITGKKLIAGGLCLAMVMQLGFALLMDKGPSSSVIHAHAAELGTVETIGKSLFTKYVFPFEAVSILLLAAIVGAVVLAKKKFQ